MEEAKALADWLTAPEQQVKAFEAKGTFPSQVDALASEELLGSTNDFFNEAPTGEIFAARADAVTMQPLQGHRSTSRSTSAMQDAITRVDVDGTDDAEQLVGQVRRRRGGPAADRGPHHLAGPHRPRGRVVTPDAAQARLRGPGLSRWDVKLSPYLYISPFFLLFAGHRAVPAALHRAGSRSTTGT